MTEPATPPTPPQWSSDYFRDAPAQAGASRPLGRGLVGHVPVVATLLIVVGVLEGFFAIFMLTFAVLALALPGREAASMGGMAILMVLLSIPAAICSVLRIIAGMYNLRFRKRTLGMVALVAGLATVFTGYCTSPRSAWRSMA